MVYDMNGLPDSYQYGGQRWTQCGEVRDTTVYLTMGDDGAVAGQKIYDKVGHITRSPVIRIYPLDPFGKLT